MILQPGERAKWLIKMLDDGSVNVQGTGNIPEAFTACLAFMLQSAQGSGQPARFVEDLLDAAKAKLAADAGEKRLSREELLKMVLDAQSAVGVYGIHCGGRCPWCEKLGFEHETSCPWLTVDRETAEVPA